MVNLILWDKFYFGLNIQFLILFFELIFFYQSCPFSNLIAWNKTWNYGKNIKLSIWALKGKIRIELMATHTYSPKFIMVLNIVLKLGLTGRPRVGTRLGWRKNRGRKNPVWPGGLTRQNSVKNSVVTRWFYFFLLKRHRFDLKKKNWPGPATGPGLKNMLLKFIFYPWMREKHRSTEK